MMRDTKFLLYLFAADRVGDDMNATHTTPFARLFRTSQAKNSGRDLCVNFAQLENVDKPFEDIAARLRWHRGLLDMTQEQYAERLGVKRSRYSRWEAGKDRLSLDGALALRRKYGLSLDFMYEGIDDALPMTLRNAWSERP